MEAIVERCCGLDVHRDSITACLLIGEPDEKPAKHVRTFGTMSRDLNEMVDWLRSHGCTHVAMESTGVYWMAPYKALEAHVEVVVGNAQHLSKVPGRKTDVLDSEWLAELLRHGLIRKSFIPPQPIRELRDLTRYRRKLVQNRSGERNRLQKLLEMANVKLASVMSDVFGASGMDILRALVEGQLAPAEMAKLARGQLRKKMELLTLALDAPFEDHHRYLLRTQLGRLEQLDRDIADVEARIDEKLEPYREQHTRLMQIPGVSGIVASVIIAEMGVDMSVFPNAQACASWAGLCPGNNESAGKRKPGRTPRGNPHLKSILVEAAQSASRKKGSYLRDKFHRIRARRGYRRASVAIAHKIVLAAYHMLASGEDYRELGEGYLDARDQKRLTQRLVGRLEGLGYQVTLQAREAKQGTHGQAEIPADSTDTAIAACDATSHPSDSATLVDSTADEAANRAPGSQSGEVATNSQADSPSPPAIASAEPTALDDSVRPPQPTPMVIVEPTAPDDSARPPQPTPASEDPPPARAKRPSRKRTSRRSSKPRDPRLPPSGTLLLRTFKGVEYQVQVTKDGFEYGDDIYSSISGVTKAITGVRQSGFAFFRLTKPWTTREEAL